MTPDRVVLVTGATGLIGGAVTLELLEQTDAEIMCLVRGRDQSDCRQRLHDALTTAARAYGNESLVAGVRDRCRALPGDLLDPRWPETVRKAELVIHAAASLKYAARDADEITNVNVNGTLLALRAAALAGARMYCQVSTAYVAGTRTGTIYETDAPPDDGSLNNCYERSKAAAERIVNLSDVPSMIVRPSIVIGHSSTYCATSFSGMYGMLDELIRFKRAVSKRLGSYLTYNPVRLLASPAASLNLLPVDYAARAIACIALSAAAGTYHVVNLTPPTVEETFEAGLPVLGLLAPRYASGESQLSGLDRKLQTEFYDSYLKNSKTFDAERACGIVGEDKLKAFLPGTEIQNYIRWYVDSGWRKGQRLADSAQRSPGPAP